MGASPDIAIGSAHAITEQGEVFITSANGSQLATFIYGAGTVIWVVGSQKIVSDRKAVLSRR